MANKKMVMTIAWEMAKFGVKRFGGKASDYLSASMKYAWRAVKEGLVDVKKVEELAAAKTKSQTATLETKAGSRNHKTWVAAITGKSNAYKYNRSFVNDYKEDGFTGRIYTLTDGVYDVCDGGDRKYIKVSNGSIATISESDIAI